MTVMEISERDWQDQIIDVARTFGYIVAHFRPAQTQRGWRTPVAADGAGYPDLTLIGRKIIWIEAKSEKGKTSPAQDAWLERIKAAGGEAYVLRPSDLDLLGRILTERRQK